MSVVDVGDAVELTFTTTPGATVTVSWYDPDGSTVLDSVAVPESGTTPGAHQYTFAPASEGVWEARFHASGTVNAVERYFVRARSLSGPPPLATVGEVAELFGTMTPAQETLTAALLRRASEMLRARFPDLTDRVADGSIPADAPAMAVINMVLRVLRNPDGLRAETTGPFSRTYDTTVAAGLLVISDSEMALMAPAGTGEALQVGTVMAHPGLADVTWGDSPAHRFRDLQRVRDRYGRWW
ncbi:hypothetical protein KBX50_05210 [Micromonospora sp. C51]|uniref:hypothetical protein n=1 Tax=Micromonospora sp. C51 TaxID=2824879 RepID=UPI001B39A045|nr:hypothetical protein [Micromonospora sp. C51]MBQ1047857.1 hypothetical protein [Micromonospora sp. C51]